MRSLTALILAVLAPLLSVRREGPSAWGAAGLTLKALPSKKESGTSAVPAAVSLLQIQRSVGVAESPAEFEEDEEIEESVRPAIGASPAVIQAVSPSFAQQPLVASSKPPPLASKLPKQPQQLPPHSQQFHQRLPQRIGEKHNLFFSVPHSVNASRNSSEVAMAAAPVVSPWPPDDTKDAYLTCNPPCIVGRGVCNDNVCFCKSPYTGTSCQHKVEALYRVTFPVLTGASILCFFIGGIFAKFCFDFRELTSAAHLDKYGEVKSSRRFENWAPPEIERGPPKRVKKKKLPPQPPQKKEIVFDDEDED